MQSISPDEILCLSKSSGRLVDDTAYIENCRTLVEKLISDGFLIIGTREQSLTHSDMDIVRKLLKDKGIKAGGKKPDLIQRILQSYTKAEIESADIPVRFVLTDRGKQVVNENSALIYYFKSLGATKILEPEQIMCAQKLYPADSELDILIRLFIERAAAETDIGKKRAITAHLGRLYKLNHNDTMANEADLEVERLDKLWEAEREQKARSLDAILGITFDERRRLEQQAIAETGDEKPKQEESADEVYRL